MVSRVVAFCDRPHEDGDRISVTTEVLIHDGVRREIDLCEDCVGDFKAFLVQQEEWGQLGREVEVKRSRRRSPSTQAGAAPGDPANRAALGAPSMRSHSANTENAEIRAWAAEQGMDIGVRGRISNTLRERFRQEKGDLAHRRWDNAAGNRAEAPLDPRAVAAVAAENAAQASARATTRPSPPVRPPRPAAAGTARLTLSTPSPGTQERHG